MNRIVRFGIVGGLCLAVQYILLHVFEHFWQPVSANWSGFVLSAQLNFLLSYTFTWRDSTRRHGAKLFRTWLLFNATVFASSIVNGVVFAGVHQHVSDAISVIIAGALSSAFTFIANHTLVLRPQSNPNGEIMELQAPSVAMFLPAWNEAKNLSSVVGKAVQHLSDEGADFTIFVINDGSTDDTKAVIGQLIAAYPNHVEAVHHPENRGYGAALKSGLQASLATGHDWIGFCDADGQFNPADIRKLIHYGQSRDADVVIGYRTKRADGLKRRLMGQGWNWISRLVLNGFRARDVDCGFKVFQRSVVEELEPQLFGDFATISPEILARAKHAGYKIEQTSVDHFPRQYGEQSGAKLRTIIGSFRGLPKIRKSIRQAKSSPLPVTVQLSSVTSPTNDDQPTELAQ